jgi:spore germination protein GerM
MKKTILILVIAVIVSVVIGAYFLTQKPEAPREKTEVEKETAQKTVETIREPVEEKKEKKEETVEITLYFVDKDGQSLVPETRTVPATQTLPETALKELIKGPGDQENKISPIPDGTKLINLSIQNNQAEVNFSREFKEKYPLGSAAENFLIYSIVNTLTEFSEVEEVRFLVEDQPLDVPGSNYDLANTYFKRNQSLIRE